jgi:hypothetical protein
MAQQLETDVVKAQEEQRRESKRATFDKLLKKPRVEREVVLVMPTDDGGSEEISFKFRSLGAQEYDALIDDHPPTTEQKIEGSAFNINTFAPGLIAKVCVDPNLSYEEMKAIWDSPDWNRGELMHLYAEAMNLCNSLQPKIPFTGSV